MEDLMLSPELQKFASVFVVLGLVQIFLSFVLANTIRTTLFLVKKENRLMVPGQAFLIVLPIFNLLWNFMVINALRDSLNNEFFDRKVAIDVDPTQNEGRFFAWSFLIRNFPLPIIMLFIAIAFNFIGFFVYWRKINEYKRLLQETADLDDIV